MITIGILKCGAVPEHMQSKHGDYEKMFFDLLGPDLNYRVFDVENGDVPTQPDDVNGWLITGSKHGVYEEHDWIPPLEQLLRNAYEASIPVVGICFGHQILAQALGGRVEKFSGGWSVGQIEYTLDGESQPTCVNAMHQDQVIEPPADAETFGSTDFCKHAFLRYKGPALTMQPHPEFNDSYTADLIKMRSTRITPPGSAAEALKNFGKPLSQQRWGAEIRDFFLKHSRA